jgi:hypothetical protein
MSNKILIFEAGIHFLSPADSYHTLYCLSVENVWINRGVLPLLTTYGDVNFEIFSSLTWN